MIRDAQENEARQAITDLANLLQVLVLSIEGEKSDPSNAWHRCEDSSAVAQRVRTTAERIASLLCAE